MITTEGHRTGAEDKDDLKVWRDSAVGVGRQLRGGIIVDRRVTDVAKCIEGVIGIRASNELNPLSA